MVELSARPSWSQLFQSTTQAQASNDDHAAIVAALGVGDMARLP